MRFLDQPTEFMALSDYAAPVNASELLDFCHATNAAERRLVAL